MVNKANIQLYTEIPESASNIWVNFSACILFFLTLGLAIRLHIFSQMPERVLFALIITVLPLIVWDLYFQNKNIVRELESEADKVSINTGRVSVKLIGFYVTIFSVLLMYHFTPLYYQSQNALDFYSPFLILLTNFLPYLIPLSMIYFCYMDRKQKDPYDEYWQFGSLVMGRFKVCRWVVILEYTKAWFIKAFFLPFMFGFLVSYCTTLTSWKLESGVFLSLFNHCLDILYAVDVLFGVLGYFWTLRILNTHIQSTEPTVLGWWMCLACYSPFYSFMGIGILPGQSDLPWDIWFAFNPVIFYSCGIVILLLTLIYAVSTVAFGYRMSNMTYRGIITSGPYRFTKHPAYVCKVASWWLISLPFFSTAGTKAALIQCASMMVVSLIYYLRAKTEENHLSNYPEYVQYAQWINDHGLFSRLGKIWPVLQYSQAKAESWNSKVWFKKG